MSHHKMFAILIVGTLAALGMLGLFLRSLSCS
jgi:hypothetical protein